MKNSPTAFAPDAVIAARSIFPGACSALLAGLISLGLPVAVSRAQPAGYDQDGAEVLTRGPVHEAFAGVVSYNPEPGIVVATPPPELIEEIPPEERPEGDDVAWIPGYWGWDDERRDYLWISGTWRVLPPGHAWNAGYWRDTGRGYQWISGYWADAAEAETTYLPPPPMTLEVGANLAAPSDDYGWTPGCWVWQGDRYAWRAGYWAQGRADWVWVPAYYVWTPRGDIFVEGFWDYPVQRRGILFAPVYYQARGYARRGYTYSPSIVINFSVFSDALFLRPSYNHYYFGDYYDSRYEQDGFYASISFQSGRHGFDPFYSHDRWEHRADRDWEHRAQASYHYRRENVAARPPRTWTWSAQLTINTRPPSGGPARIMLAAPIAQLARSRDNPVRFQPVDQGDRQKLAQRGREVQQSRDQRRTVEAKAAVTPGRNAGEAVAPVKVSAPRSPIAAKPDTRRSRNEAPPARPPAPRPDPKVSPQAENSARPANADRRNSLAEPRQPETDRNTPADRRGPETQPAADARRIDGAARIREEPRNAPEAQAKAQQDDERRAKNEEAKAQGAARSQQQAGERANASAAKARDDSQRKEQQTQDKAQQNDDRRARDENAKAQGVARAQPQADDRANASAAKARDDAPRKEQPAPARAQPDDERRARDAAAKARPPAKDKAAEDEDAAAKKDKSH